MGLSQPVGDLVNIGNDVGAGSVRKVVDQFNTLGIAKDFHNLVTFASRSIIPFFSARYSGHKTAALARSVW